MLHLVIGAAAAAPIENVQVWSARARAGRRRRAGCRELARCAKLTFFPVHIYGLLALRNSGLNILQVAAPDSSHLIASWIAEFILFRGVRWR